MTFVSQSEVPQSRRTGLTLLELMVVLVILAIVATVALQTLQPQVEQQRFDSASRLLNEIQAAVIGPVSKFQTDGTPLISGFVADVGRLPDPQASLAADSPLLGELWSTETSLATQFPFQFRSGPNQPTDYSDIRIPCGWRGPYLQLPIGSRQLTDPWGQPLEIVPGIEGNSQQVKINLPPSDRENALESLQVDLGGGRVNVTGKVLLDTPDNATVKVALLTCDPQRSLTSLVVMDDEDNGKDSFRFQNVAIGMRAIVCDVNGQRQVKYLQVPHTGLNVVFDFQDRTSN